MMPLSITGAVEQARPRRVLCLGAHADDIEIGCGGTVLRLVAAYPDIAVRWVVLSGDERRATEARCSASLFLADVLEPDVTLHSFRDGYFPSVAADIKAVFEELKTEPAPDLIFTHHRADRHQDHRVVAELTWNTFRDHFILEYEIPKYDGHLGSPNVFVPIDADTRARKIAYLMRAFGSQRSKSWFTEDTFAGLMRLRGVECASPDGSAEGFTAEKVLLAVG